MAASPLNCEPRSGLLLSLLKGMMTVRVRALMVRAMMTPRMETTMKITTRTTTMTRMTERVARRARSGLLILTLCLAALTRQASAQVSAPTFLGATASQLQATAVLELPPSLSWVAAEPQYPGAQAVRARAGRRDGEIWMIVGGAAILTGLLVDEGLITIAGAAVGGYGLYLYLRAPRRRPA